MHKLDRNMPCWCGSGKKYKHCHYDFDEKLDDMHRRGAIIPTHDMIKNEAQIAGIRESAKINVAVLDYVAAHIRAGISTAEIDRWVYEQTTAMGGIPAPLNYEGFPKSVCTSIDDQVCHGIPSEDDILCNGDIINVDCSTIYKGYYSDSSRMFIIGETTPEKKKLVEVTRECVMAGLEQVKPWGFLGGMGQARRAVGQLCDPARAGNGDGAGHDVHHRADDQYGHGRHLRRCGQRLDDLHGGRHALRSVGNSSAGDGDGPRSHLMVRRPLSSPP